MTDGLVTDGDERSVRAAVSGFLADALPDGWTGLGALDREQAERFVERWRGVLHEHRWLAPCWPERFGGRGLDSSLQPVITEEFARAAAPTGGPNDPQGIEMLGQTLLHGGRDELCVEFLPPTLDGTIRWAEGFSEPDAGSDLAAVRTSAVCDGDEWIVTGQKVWTSNALTANWIFLLARTDPDAAKHRGLTFLLMPLDQPDVEIRPVRQLSGEAEFCEVYFDGARADRRHVVGEVDGGWPVALALLANERAGISTTMPMRFGAEFERLVALARSRGRAADPLVRQALAAAYTDGRLIEWNGARAARDHHTASRMAPATKIAWTEFHQRSALLGTDLLGADALAPSGRAPSSVFGPDDIGADPLDSRSWTTTMLNSRAATIYAGTNEVNRNVVAEQLLGLPREPRPADGSGR